MAILKESVSGGSSPFKDRIGDRVAPPGTWVAMIIDIRDEFGVMRPRFKNNPNDPDVLEKQDVTTFLFGFRDQANQQHMIDSKTHRISGNEKSGLFKMLRQMLGTAPKYGWDYCEMKGTKCLITVDHAARRDGNGVFVSISAFSPLPAGFGVGAVAQAAPLQAAVAPQAAFVPTAPAQAPAAPLPVDDEPLPF